MVYVQIGHSSISSPGQLSNMSTFSMFATYMQKSHSSIYTAHPDQTNNMNKFSYLVNLCSNFVQIGHSSISSLGQSSKKCTTSNVSTFSMFATYTQKSHPPMYTAHLSSSSQPSPQVKMKFRQLPEVQCLFVLCNIKVITFKEFSMVISQ